ncbi:MAG: porin [Bacteroidota bacterium]
MTNRSNRLTMMVVKVKRFGINTKNLMRMDIRIPLSNVILSIAFLSIYAAVNGQTPGMANKQESASMAKIVEGLASDITPYGSIRIGFGFSERGEAGVSNNVPRVGIEFEHPILNEEPDKFRVVSRIEFGLDLVSRDETIEFTPDPGQRFSQAGDAVFTRLGYIGLAYGDFSFVFGKNNAVYYTYAASVADKFLAFGGNALGVWNAGTDGGISGTGRANQSAMFTYEGKRFKVGVQGQMRNISDNSTTIDTYGFGANYTLNDLTLGVGYNKVVDGVTNPEPNQSVDGDESLIFTVSYAMDRFTAAASYAFMNKHEKIALDDGDFFYNADGMELYLKYVFSPSLKWHVASGFSYINPDSDQNLGDFDVKFGLLELAYMFKKSSYIFIVSKLEASQDREGNDSENSIYGLGIRFSF